MRENRGVVLASARGATVELNLEDLRDLVISAVRYALHRRTYITVVTSNIVRALDEKVFNPRVVSVMLNDLERYYIERKNMACPDDECDKEAWDRLYAFLKEKRKELSNEANGKI